MVKEQKQKEEEEPAEADHEGDVFYESAEYHPEELEVKHSLPTYLMFVLTSIVIVATHQGVH